MSLATNISDLATRIATEFKTVRTLISGSGTGDVSGLSTTATDLVAAINEVKTTADAAAGGGAAVNDAVTKATDAWSSQKINDEITAAVDALVDGAPGALDTLNELAAALGDDSGFQTAVTNALAARVRTDTAVQGLTGPQQSNARTNIDAASATDVGDTATDFVATFNTGLA